MRVTHEMIAKQVVFNLSNNIERFFKLQNMMSTNRRINKVSDDPIGTIKDLSYRERLTEIGQYKANIAIGSTWLASSDRALNDVNTAVADAHSIAVEMSNDTFDAVARNVAANEVQSLLDQILAAGNSQLQNNYLFSGYRTRTQPFEASGTGVVYRGDQGVIQYSIDAKAKVQVNTIGSNLLTKPFQVIGADSDLSIGIVGATPLAILNAGTGVDAAPGTFVVRDDNLNIAATIDISAATTVADAISAINTQLAAAGITNLTASLGLEGNNLRLVATGRPEISLTTPLANLNQGTGIDANPGKFTIRNGSGTITATVDLSAAVTIGDALNAINTQLAAAGATNVTAALNGSGTAIEITDTNGVPLGLYIEENSAFDTTARTLGLVGSIGAILTGLPLDPRPAFTVSESASGETTAANLGLIGSFTYNHIGAALEPQLEPTTLLAQIQNNLGAPLGTLRISQGEASVVINTSSPGITTVQDLIDAINNAGLNITAAINPGATGIQITNNDPTRTLMIANNDDQRVATMLGIAGAADVLGTIMLLVDALRNDDRKTVENLVGTLDTALNAVLNERASVGAKVIRMDTTLSRLEEYEVNYTKLLSEVEDADITKLITDLAMQENAYSAALNSAAKILQPSLLNFIR